MKATRCLKWLAAGAGFGLGAYITYAGFTWYRYGNAATRRDDDADEILDRFMPVYEVIERHRIRVAAPAELTFLEAVNLDLNRSAIIRALFKGREWILGGGSKGPAWSGPLIAQLRTLGWGVLAEVPGHEVVMGAFTQPWQSNVVFRSLAPEEFVSFQEPGYVKIAWTLRVDPISAVESVARTETRVVATDPDARQKFRPYWSFLSPGIILIRRIALGLVKREAEGAW
jgi:hypothetical protein